MDMDFEKAMAMLDGKTPDEFTKSQLSDIDKQQIDNAIELIFSGLSLQTWLNGGILRDAWNHALDTVRDMVFAINVNNAATNYAREAVFFHRRKWHVKVMYAPHATKTISCPTDKRAEWEKSARDKIQNGTDILRHKITEFETTDIAQRNTKNAMQNISWQDMQLIMDTREHEHEHVREREK